MKKIIVLFLFVGLLAGCHDAPEPPPVLLGKITASIDGKPYETTDLLLISNFPEDKTISFGITKENTGLYFRLNNVEAALLKGISNSNSSYDGTSTFTMIFNDKDRETYYSQKGQYLVQSREGNRIKATFWGELSNLTQTKTIVIEGGTIDIILPDRRYLRE